MEPDDLIESTIKIISKDNNKVVVSINVPSVAIYHEITSIVSQRDHARAKAFKARFGVLQTDILGVFQKLAFLMELCRHNRIPTLAIEDGTGKTTTTILEMENLIYHPKDCCRVKTPQYPSPCIRIGVITCSRCLITCWCSEDCLTRSYDTHQPLCDLAYKYRKELDV